MDIAALAFAFSAGMLASVNPCGFAMLPTFITYYLVGSDEREQAELHERLLRALWLGIWVTVGFLFVFVITGIILSAGGHALIEITPWLGILIGGILVVIGLRYLFSYGIAFSLPIPAFDTPIRGLRGMFLYGVSYAAISLSCTLPIFLSVFSGALSVDNWLSGVVLFFAYSLGMGTIITTLALATALFQSAVMLYLRRLIPYVKNISAVALILAGIYLIYYQIAINPFLKI
jgi:cytochrome c biogenesis protein CcdA